MSQQNNSGLNIFIGICAVIVGHVVAIATMVALASVPSILNAIGDSLLYAFFGIGFTQLIYVVPLCLWLHQCDRIDTFKGVVIAALITLLLNGGCFIWFFSLGL